MKKCAVKDGWFLDDWGPIPEQPAPAGYWVRAAGEALLIPVVFTLGMLLLLLGVIVYVVVLAVLLCIYPVVRVCSGPHEEPRP